MYKPKTLHASLVKNGLLFNIYQCNLLLRSYINSGAFSDAHKFLNFIPHTNSVSFNTILSGFFKNHLINEGLKFFESAPKKNCQSWNIIISGCIQNHSLKSAFTYFIQMRRNSIKPDNFTYSIVIPCCGLDFGQQVHAVVVKVCSDLDAFIGTNLIKMYAAVGDVMAARKVFDGMTTRDLVTWNAMISCYSKCGMGYESVELFQEGGREGVVADEYTYAIVLNEFIAHSQVIEAMQVHSLIIRRGLCSDCFISSSLVNMYAKCGLVTLAFLLFQDMPYQDVVSWTVVISGFSQGGHVEKAFWLFHKMRLSDVEPNSYTVGTLISSCASSSALQRGKQIHGLVFKYGIETSNVVGSAVVDMYSKCGVMGDALRMFQRIPVKDIVSWNAIICGFAQNGEGMKALKLYDELLLSEPSIAVPNDVTFIGVLSACCHTGLLKEGYSYFTNMIQKHLISPKKEHYTCMVDLLARAGLLDEAEALMQALPFKPDGVMWSALLGACKLHGNISMARTITERPYGDEPCNSSNYVLLSNSYIENGRWSEAQEVREMMDTRGVQKTCGCSWVEIESCMHSFLAGKEIG